MYLFFDSETSGLPHDWNAPVAQTANWPRLVQLGWLRCDPDGTPAGAREYLIKPNGFVISREAIKKHGITTERALAEGVALEPVLAEFSKVVETAQVVVAHNVSFDEKVVGAEFLRAGMMNVLERKKQYCTMKGSADYCQLPGRYGFKWPTLSELHEKLFGEAFTGAHSALADCTACMRCFFRLKELGHSK